MVSSLASTCSLLQYRRWALCAISRPDTATPPALLALPGAYSTLPDSMNVCTASSVLGMLAPSATHCTPFLTNVRASSPLSSFCVAQGRAMSTGTCQGVLPSSYWSLNCSAYSLMRPRFTFLMCIRAASFSGVKPAGSTTVPLESDAVMTLAPHCMAFSMAYCDTLPEPETETVLPSSERPLRCSISRAKYTVP